jgi:hypothetical protein
VSRGELRSDVAATLAAADIPASKLGPARRARLDDAERELYVWILRRFATGGRPGHEQVCEEAERLGGDAERMLASLAREDLVHLGPDGEIAVAYPFSGRPTAHRVRFPTGHEVDAMCAIDALGIAPMFGEPIEITSIDPVTREEISVQLAPGSDSSWQPESAVVVAGVVAGAPDACSGCCQVLNFFASGESAERWIAGHPEVRGRPISIPTAIAAGRAVFGSVLEGE